VSQCNLTHKNIQHYRPGPPLPLTTQRPMAGVGGVWSETKMMSTLWLKNTSHGTSVK